MPKDNAYCRLTFVTTHLVNILRLFMLVQLFRGGVGCAADA